MSQPLRIHGVLNRIAATSALTVPAMPARRNIHELGNSVVATNPQPMHVPPNTSPMSIRFLTTFIWCP
jgi:hypothetical protein